MDHVVLRIFFEQLLTNNSALKLDLWSSNVGQHLFKGELVVGHRYFLSKIGRFGTWWNRKVLSVYRKVWSLCDDVIRSGIPPVWHHHVVWGWVLGTRFSSFFVFSYFFFVKFYWKVLRNSLNYSKGDEKFVRELCWNIR